MTTRNPEVRTLGSRSPEPPSRGPVLASLYAGLVLTVLSVAAVYVDRASTGLLAAHLEAGYPSYSASEIDEAVGLWTIVLTTVGALGVIGWVLAIWAVRRGARWAGWLVGSLFTLGTVLALYLLTVRDNNGETGLPMELGLVGLVPSVAGLVAVLLMWRARKPVRRGIPA
jgi:hypothetical protein